MKKVLFILISFFAIACPAHADVTQLHIGVSTGYPPFYFFDENKQPAGTCIDIIRQVADGVSIRKPRMARSGFPNQKLTRDFIFKTPIQNEEKC